MKKMQSLLLALAASAMLFAGTAMADIGKSDADTFGQIAIGQPSITVAAAQPFLGQVTFGIPGQIILGSHIGQPADIEGLIFLGQLSFGPRALAGMTTATRDFWTNYSTDYLELITVPAACGKLRK